MCEVKERKRNDREPELLQMRGKRSACVDTMRNNVRALEKIIEIFFFSPSHKWAMFEFEIAASKL